MLLCVHMEELKQLTMMTQMTSNDHSATTDIDAYQIPLRNIKVFQNLLHVSLQFSSSIHCFGARAVAQHSFSAPFVPSVTVPHEYRPVSMLGLFELSCSDKLTALFNALINMSNLPLAYTVQMSIESL